MSSHTIDRKRQLQNLDCKLLRQAPALPNKKRDWQFEGAIALSEEGRLLELLSGARKDRTVSSNRKHFSTNSTVCRAGATKFREQLVKLSLKVLIAEHQSTRGYLNVTFNRLWLFVQGPGFTAQAFPTPIDPNIGDQNPVSLGQLHVLVPDHLVQLGTMRYRHGDDLGEKGRGGDHVRKGMHISAFPLFYCKKRNYKIFLIANTCIKIKINKNIIQSI